MGQVPKRAVLLLALAGLLAASGLALGGGRSQPSARGRTANEKIRFLWVQAGLPKRHDKDLEDTSSAGRGVLVVPGDTAEGKDGVVAGKGGQELVELGGKDRLSFAFQTGKYYSSGILGDMVQLYGDVTSSTDPLCPAIAGGEPRAVYVQASEGAVGGEKDAMLIRVAGCSLHSYTASARSGVKNAKVQVVVDSPSSCRAPQTTIPTCPLPTSPPPTRVTLTVNGWSLSATKAKPAAYLHHEEDQQLASGTPLKIRATIDRELPRGWTLTVYHNSDLLSPGNGVYYVVCEIKSPSTSTSCGKTRPGRTGPLDDTVWAAVSAPTYLAMHSDIIFRFKAP